jgi:NADPH:quinone reductase-like Zn-dependent oxidoreductase
MTSALEHPPRTTPAASDPTATMRSIVQDRYGAEPGAVLRLADVERPTVGDDGILVRIAAASVDKGTWHVMTGMPYAMRVAGFGVRVPKAQNPGRALAGTVAAIGKGVSGFQVGDEVYGTTKGSFAEYALVEGSKLSRKPANLSFEQAAAVPISGGTALQAVRKAGVQPGQHVLVIGASGGVGSFVVQIAKALGAEVTGVCRTDKVDLVRSLGADHVIDYSSEDFTVGGGRYDVIIDTGGMRRLSHLRRVMTPRGTLVLVGGETGGRWLGGFQRSLLAAVLSPFVSQKLTMLASTEKAADFDALRGLIEAGQVVPAIDRAYLLSEAPAAIQHVQDGRARGKVVITV